MKSLTAEQAIAGLREVVAQYGPDVTYNDRWYALTSRPTPPGGVAPCKNSVSSGTNVLPACIVGEVLAKHIPIRLVPVSAGVYRTADVLREDGTLSIADDAVGVLGGAQAMQDNGATWGRALAEAERIYASIAERA